MTSPCAHRMELYRKKSAGKYYVGRYELLVHVLASEGGKCQIGQ